MFDTRCSMLHDRHPEAQPKDLACALSVSVATQHRLAFAGRMLHFVQHDKEGRFSTEIKGLV